MVLSIGEVTLITTATAWAALLLPPLMALIAARGAIDLWRVSDARQHRSAAMGLVAVGVGTAFYVALLVWLIAKGRMVGFFAGPLSGGSALYAAIMVGLGVSFLVIALGIVLERPEIAGRESAALTEREKGRV